MDSLVVVFGVFCGAPFLFFWIGWFVRGWAARYRLVKRESAADGAGYAQVSPAGSGQPGQIKRVGG